MIPTAAVVVVKKADTKEIVESEAMAITIPTAAVVRKAVMVVRKKDMAATVAMVVAMDTIVRK